MKNLKNLGKTLNKSEQKAINGGGRNIGISDGDCNEQQQNQISCDPYGMTGFSCELDAYCSPITHKCTCID